MSRSPDTSLSIKANIAWNTIGNFAYLFSQWLLTYIVARLLGYEDAGILSLATSISGSLVSISLYGMRSFQVSDIKETYTNKAYIVSRWVTSAAALFVCIAFVLVNGYSGFVGSCIIVYMGFKISESVSDVYQGILQKRMRMDYIGVSFLVKGIMTLVVFLLAVLVTRNLLVAICAMAATSVVIVGLYDRRKAKDFPSDYRTAGPHAVYNLLIECMPLAVFAFLFNTLTLAPRYYLEIALGAEALGIYASVAMPVVIVQVSASYVFAPLITPFAKCLDEGDIKAFISLMKRIIFFIGALSIVALVGFAVIGEWGLVFLFGDSMIPHTYLLMPLVVCTILVAISWFFSTLLTILRKLKSLLVICVVAFIVVVVGGFPCIEFFGMNGASFVLICGLAVYTLLAFMLICREIRQ